MNFTSNLFSDYVTSFNNLTNDFFTFLVCVSGFYLGWIFNKNLTENYIKNDDVIKIKANDYNLLSHEEKLFWKRIKCTSCHRDLRKYFYILGIDTHPTFSCDSLVCKFNNLK
jgi:hypothetical protein